MHTAAYEYYMSRKALLDSGIARHRRRNTLFVVGEIALFALFIAFVAAAILAGLNIWKASLGVLSLLAYIAVRRFDELNEVHTERLATLREVCRRELAYLDGDYSAFDDGKRYADASHPFAADIDIFGCKSLYQRVCRTVTSGGSDRLAAMLSSEPVECDCVAEVVETFDAEKAVKERIDKRADAIWYLAKLKEWRAEFCAVGVAQSIDTAAVAGAMHAVRNVKVGQWVLSSAAVVVALLMCIGLTVTIAMAVVGDVPSGIAVVWALVQLGVVLGLCHGTLMKASRASDRLHKQISSYVRLVRIIHRLPCIHVVSTDGTDGDCPELVGCIVGALEGAVESLQELDRIIGRLDRRGNVLALVIADTFTLADWRLLRSFAKWQSRLAHDMDRWMAAVGQMDALVSMATFCYNEPSGIRAHIVDADGVVFDAKDLRHPFLGDGAVGNDFSIADHQYYIITGANMAGKSTFLRSLGINWLLAMSGMPVFASELRVSVFALFTSMRTTDDLTRGISYFNAELLRLKSLIGFCSCHDNTLIILDEILKGTNSADKLAGSRLFLEYISCRRVTGIIATHDLELSRLADERPSQFHNYCFEIGLERDITYTYRITPGVARNQNATFLLKSLLS